MAQRLLKLRDMIDPKVVTEIKASRPAPGNATGNPPRSPDASKIPAGSAGEALFG
jgi:hypothetical protein